MISKTIGFRGTNHFQTHPDRLAVTEQSVNVTLKNDGSVGLYTQY